MSSQNKVVSLMFLVSKLNALTHVYDTCWIQPSPIRIDSNCTEFSQLENVSHLVPLDETDLRTDDLASYYYSKINPTKAPTD